MASVARSWDCFDLFDAASVADLLSPPDGIVAQISEFRDEVYESCLLLCG